MQTDTHKGPALILALAILFVHLFLSPLVFSAATVEVFEYNKVAILTVTAIVLGTGALGGLAARWLAGASLQPRDGDASWAAFAGRMLREPVALGHVLFFVSALASTAVSISQRTSVYGAHESFAGIITMASYLVLFWATRQVVRDAQGYRILLFATAMAVAGASIYGVMQLTGLDHIRWGRTSEYGGITRAFATMGHPNFLSAFLVMGFPVACYFAVRAFRQGLTHLGVGLVLTALLCEGMVITSISRGAWVALGVTVFVFAAGAWLVAKDRVTPALIVGGNLLALVLVIAALSTFPDGRSVLESMQQRFGRMLDTRAVTQESRGYIWECALMMLRDHPITGVGLDGFQLAFEHYRTTDYWKAEWNGTPTKAHNEALHILATQGLLGGLATIVMTVGLVVAFVRAAKRPGADRLLLVTALAGAAGFYVQNLFSFTVAGCGTLFVTYCALLSRLGAPPLPEDAPGARGIEPTKGDAEGQALGFLARVVALGVATGLAWTLVVVPYMANNACRMGALYLERQPEVAVRLLNEAVAIDPSKELYWVRLGTANQLLARTRQDPGERRAALLAAKAAYEESIRLVPANSYNHANLGRLLSDMAKENPPLANVKDAYERFRKALEVDPNNAYFYADAGNTALSFGDYELADRWSAECVEKYPDFGPPISQQGYIRLMRASQLQREGKIAEGQLEFNEAVKLLRRSMGAKWENDRSGRAIAGSNLGASLIRVGRYAEAEQAAREALATEGMEDYADARFNLARALEMQGKLLEAHEQYVAILARQPGHGMARDALRALRRRMLEAGMPLPVLPEAVKRAIGEAPAQPHPEAPGLPPGFAPGR